MPARRGTLAALSIAIAIALTGAPPALAAPFNDAPAGAVQFERYSAANGRPRNLQATAELVDATADPGVPRCLGTASFARTAWYWIAPAPTPQVLGVEAFGRTLDVVDLAAFVQPAGATAPVTRTPNACAGAGAGGADSAEEPTSGIALRVPSGRAVLVQAGRRGAPGPADDERALLSLDVRKLPVRPAPVGDVARPGTPTAASTRATFLSLRDATITEEDPAMPSCPSLGTVWRRVVPGADGLRVVTVSGASASTLAVFRGTLPTAANALDCVNRSGYGSLQVRVRVQRRKPIWVRVGTSIATGGSGALLRVTDGARNPVIDGGPGGFDPTPGGPGGGLPSACDRAAAERARIRGPRFGGRAAAARRRSSVVLRLNVSGSSACDARLTLVGPGGDVFASARVTRLHGRQSVRLAIERPIDKGRYRLAVEARSERGGLAKVRTKVRGRWR